MSPTIIDKPKTKIDRKVLKALQAYESTEGQVIIHGFVKTQHEDMFIRIWPTTFLFDQHSSYQSELVHYEKISGFPTWTLVPSHSEFVFTLIFSALPKSCIIFDLVELIPQSNGFQVKNILRNDTDVYYLDFNV
ncbi:MAG TPA: hypothetical protein VK169_00165 [Saprospiraceae bacterium]|nr:hypothetical protein [Saprospiraceae bacterium]